MQSSYPLNLLKGKIRCTAARLSVVCGALIIAAVFATHTARTQNFSSGSTGADGALDFSNLAPGTIVEFNPDSFNPPLDQDRDNVYHFTTINVPAGVTVRLSARYLNGPVYWLATGAVQINGTLDLNGQDGQNSTILINSGSRFPSIPGAGGFEGGFGAFNSSPQVGNGPGGGQLATRGDHDGGSAGHAGFSHCGDVAAQPYGNAFLVPLVGGSGGAGAHSGAGGGAGGGAILITSSVSIMVNGTIMAIGGRGGNFSINTQTKGGAGSGGSIRLIAPTLSGTGTLNALGGHRPFGLSTEFCGSHGRVRMEAFQHALSINLPSGGQRSFPNALSIPSTPPSSVRVVSIAGVPLPPNPTGSFEIPDLNIDASAATTVVIEGRFVPVGTIVRLHLVSEDGADQIVGSAPLAGTLQQSSATASVVFPRGFTRGFARAVWR